MARTWNRPIRKTIRSKTLNEFEENKATFKTQMLEKDLSTLRTAISSCIRKPCLHKAPSSTSFWASLFFIFPCFKAGIRPPSPSPPHTSIFLTPGVMMAFAITTPEPLAIPTLGILHRYCSEPVPRSGLTAQMGATVQPKQLPMLSSSH